MATEVRASTYGEIARSLDEVAIEIEWTTC